METIKWDDSFSVEVKSLDDQHKKLINLFNELFKKVNLGSDKKLSKKIIKSLKEYTIYHFSTEEKYFDEFNYYLSDNHKKQHQFFIQKIEDFESKLNKDMIKLEIANFLLDWIFNHIYFSDKLYSDLFISKGLH